MEKNDWLHNLGAGVVAVFLMVSPIICVSSWKVAFSSANDAEIFGYVLLVIVSSLATVLGTILMYLHIKEC